MEDLLYPDEILVDLAKNFSHNEWTILALIGSRIQQKIEENDVPAVLTNEIERLSGLGPQHYRVHLARLEASNAINISIGHADRRTRVIQLRKNGYRMMELKQGGKFNA